MSVADYVFIVLFDAVVFLAGYKFYEYRLRRSGSPGSMPIN